jgi:thiol-disulfide isomerase/thioredoxin
MKKLLFLIFLTTLAFHVSAQNYAFDAKIKNLNSQRAYLRGFKGEQTILLDSASVLEGCFKFSLLKGYKPGVYMIVLGESDNSNFTSSVPFSFDFIFNQENIHVESDNKNLIDSMKFIGSAENEIFYSFLKNAKIFNQKQYLIRSLLDIYPDGDPLYSSLSEEYINIQQNNSRLLTDLTGRLPGSVAASIIKLNLGPIIDPSIKGTRINEFYREHYFDLLSFTDERILNTPYCEKKFIEYFSFYVNPDLTNLEQEKEYSKAIDKIMDKVSVNPVIYDYALNLLIDTFEKYNLESVLVYIAENYIEGGCETNSKKLMEKRLAGYQKMAVGKKGPDILMLDENGTQIRLYNLKSEYVLVLFWASWCPHCANMLPQLKKWYDSKTINLEVYAVSIDSSRFIWEENLLMNNYGWINTCTFAGWNDKAAKDYNIYATPTMFLLDRERKIIAKPLTYREFRKEVDKL